MGGGKFGVELPTMQAAAQHVDEVNNQIQAQLTSLLSRLEPLKGAWKGEGATSFNSLIERWHQDATQLNQVLQTIGERLQQTHGNVTQVEGEVGQSFNTITGRLG
jgi:WXG100 family type VII secretion target